MTDPVPATPAPEHDDVSQRYAPYAQLVKMLVPSSGCIAIYDTEGDLLWCSDGYERPDLRELVDELKSASGDATRNFNRIQQTSSGVSAYGSMLRADDARPLGFVVVQLGSAQSGARGNTMVPSLLRPVLECLAGRIGLERRAAEPAPRAERTEAPDDLGLLLGAENAPASGRGALEHLVEHCMESLGCVGGAFLVPEKGISVLANHESAAAAASSDLVTRTQKHLLAWAQLNNRPMVVNRIGTEAGMAPYKILSCPVRDPAERVTGLMALFRPGEAPNFEIRDVRILEYMSRKAMSIINSEHDALTGLMNRVSFERRVEAALRAAHRRTCALIYLDIDQLQAINDAFGFQAGDEVIRRVAQLIRETAGADHPVCRIAGDRFAVCCLEADREDCRALAAHLLDSAAQLGYLQDGEAVPVSLSVGVAYSGGSASSFDHLLAAAEIACKRARAQGGGRVEVDETGERCSPLRERELVAAASIKQALLANEFTLQAQPIVDLYSDTARVVGYEVLVRMRDAAGATISADKFIEAAEHYDLTPAIDKWVLAAAAKAFAGHASLVAALPLGIAVNLSVQSVASPDFADFAVAEIRRSGLPPETFCFEIRESDAVRRLPETERFIARMTAAGVQVSLDDFGAGLSSLAHLKRLKVSHLKIDGALIRRVREDVHAESLVRGLARAAQTLGVLTVAEHVENEALATKLKGMEVDLVQGYHYGRPEPLERALAACAPMEPVEPARQS